MRALLALFLSSSVHAAPWTARVVHEGAPVSGARVTVFAPRQKPLAGCKSSPRQDVLGQCLCPAGREAFTKRAIAGLEAAPPAASATTGADGSFSLSLQGPGPFRAHVSSADGALVANTELSAETRELSLAPGVVHRIRLSGLTTGAAVYLIDPSTGELTRLEQREGVWVSPPLSPGMRTLVAVAPGAAPLRQTMIDGRLVGGGMPGMGQEKGPPTVTLSAPQTVRGVVTEGGNPVSGVEVIADPETCAITAKTTATGEFSLPSPNSPPFLTVVTARARGKIATAYGSGERMADLALKPEARLELTFVDAKGAPMPGVELWVTGQDGSNRQVPPSDAQGRWTMSGLVDGTIQLRVNAPHVLMSDAHVQVKGVTRLRPVVARGVTLSGRVLDAKGRPVRRAHVSAFFGDALQTKVPDSLKEALRSVGYTTDAQGTFELKGLLPGEYELVAKSPEFGEGTLLATAPGKVELTLAAPFVMEGVVVDSAGKPVEKAAVSFHRKDEPNMSYGTSTEPDGHFRYALKGPGTFEVTVRRSGSSPPSGKPVLAEIPGDALELVVGDVLSIRGTVVDSSGSPRAGVVVQAIPFSMPILMAARVQRQKIDPVPLVMHAKMMRQYAETTSAQDGTFTLDLGADALVFAEADGQSAEPVNGSPKAPVKLVLTTRARATGRVLDWNGRPVQAFSINGKQFDSPEGRFELPLPSRGPATLRIDGALAPYETRTVEVPEGPVEVPLGDLKLKRGFTVTGKVLAAQTGKPITPSPFVDARSALGQFDNTGVQQDGTFTLRRVPEGPLELTVSNKDYAPAGASIEVKAGVKEVILKLEKPASLEVSVLRKGEPAPGLSVEASGPPIPTYPTNKRSHTSASDGRVMLEQLSPGAWTVKAGATVKTVQLKPGQAAKLDLAVP